jgi:biotin synthase-related radical SAM superfamily protein
MGAVPELIMEELEELEAEVIMVLLAVAEELVIEDVALVMPVDMALVLAVVELA